MASFPEYNYTMIVSDDEGDGEGEPSNPDTSSLSPPMRAETTSESASVEESKPTPRKVRVPPRPAERARPLQRECSRPEV